MSFLYLVMTLPVMGCCTPLHRCSMSMSKEEYCVLGLVMVCIAIISGECKGIHVEDGSVIVMIGDFSWGLNRDDFPSIGALWLELIITGNWPGVLARIILWCTHGAFLITLGWDCCW